MQRNDIGLNFVTSFAWSTFVTGHIRAIVQVDWKTLLLMIWTNGEVTSSTTGFKYDIVMSSWPVEQFFFYSKKNFSNFIVVSIIDFKRIWVYIIWDILKEFKLKYGSFILRDRREAKDVKWLLISEWWSFMRSCCLFNILCSVSWALAGCLSESALRRKLALVSLIVFKVCFWCFDSLYDY